MAAREGTFKPKPKPQRHSPAIFRRRPPCGVARLPSFTARPTPHVSMPKTHTRPRLGFSLKADAWTLRSSTHTQAGPPAAAAKVSTHARARGSSSDRSRDWRGWLGARGAIAHGLAPRGSIGTRKRVRVTCRKGGDPDLSSGADGREEGGAGREGGSCICRGAGGGLPHARRGARAFIYHILPPPCICLPSHFLDSFPTRQNDDDDDACH